MRRLLFVLALVVALGAGYLAVGAVGWAAITAVNGDCMAINGDQTPATFDARWGGVTELDAAPYRFTDARDVAFPSLTPGLELRAWWAPPTNPAAGAVVVVHGRNSCRHDPAVLLPAGMLHKNGFGVLLLDLRNHGTSDTENGHWGGGTDEWQDVLGAWHWLRGQGYPAASIGLLGLSMGAGAVVYAIGEEPAVAAAWLDSPYADIVSMSIDVAANPLQKVFAPGALLMGQLIGGDDFLGPSPVQVLVEHLDGRPLAIVHGTADTTIPVEQGEQLAAAAARGGTPVTPWIITGARHVESAFVAPAEYERRVTAFFRKNLAPPKP